MQQCSGGGKIIACGDEKKTKDLGNKHPDLEKTQWRLLEVMFGKRSVSHSRLPALKAEPAFESKICVVTKSPSQRRTPYLA